MNKLTTFEEEKLREFEERFLTTSKCCGADVRRLYGGKELGLYCKKCGRYCREIEKSKEQEVKSFLTSSFQQQREMMSKEASESRKQTLKELILEQQANELEGKGYDFYFNIRTKLDALLSDKEI